MDLIIVLNERAVVGAVDVVGHGADFARGAAGVAEQKIGKAVVAVLAAEGEGAVEVGIRGLVILHVQHVAADANGVAALVPGDHIVPVEIVDHVTNRIGGAVAESLVTGDAEFGKAGEVRIGSGARDAVLCGPIGAGVIADFVVRGARQPHAEFVDQHRRENACFRDAVERLDVIGGGAECAERAAGERIVGRLPPSPERARRRCLSRRAFDPP